MLMYNARKCKLVADRCTPAGYKRVKRIMKGIKEEIMKPYAEMTKDELVALDVYKRQLETCSKISTWCRSSSMIRRRISVIFSSRM